MEQLKLKDAWLCAGAIRNYIWNILSGRSDGHNWIFL